MFNLFGSEVKLIFKIFFKRLVFKIMVIKLILYSLVLFLFGTRILLGQISVNTISQNQTICAGNTLNITGSLPAGCSGNYQYQWESSLNQTNWSNTGYSTQNYIDILQISGQIYFRRIVFDLNCQNDTSNIVIVAILPPISNDSISPNQLRYCLGFGQAVFGGIQSSPTGGNGLYSYVWESSNDGNSFFPVPGQTNQSINHFFAAGIVDTIYFRRITSSFTCSSSYSNLGIVMIDSPPPSTIIYPWDQYLCYGDTPTILYGWAPVSNFGTYTYSWAVTDLNTLSGPVPGATASTLQLGPATSTQTLYYIRTISLNNCSSYAMNSCVIHVYPQVFPPTNLIGDTICRPFSAIVRGSPGSGANQIRWYDSLTGGNLLGVGDSLIVSPLTTTTYYAESFNSQSGCINSTRMPAVVIVNTISNAIHSGVIDVCVPDSVILTASPGAGGNSVIWYDSWGNVLHLGSPYRIYVSGQTVLRVSNWDTINGCISTNTTSFIRSSFPIGNNFISSDQTICTGTSPITLSGSTPTGGAFFFNYQWQSSPDAFTWANIPGSNAASYLPSNVSSMTYFRRIYSSPPCPADTSNVVSIEVTPRIGNNTIDVPSNQFSTCAGLSHASILGSIPTGGNGSYTYQWFTSHQSGPWGPVSYGTSADILCCLNNVMLDTGSFRYYRVISSGNCPPDTVGPILIYVYPRVSNLVLSAHQTICSGTAPQALTSSTPTGGTGNWTQIQWMGGIFPNIVPVGSGNPYQPGILTTTVPMTITYAAAAGAGCSTSSCCVYVTVIPPILNNLITASQTVCPFGAVALLSGSTPTGGGGTFSYQWLSSHDTLQWAITGHTAADYPPPPPAQTVYYRRLVTENISPCPADSGSTLSIQIIPPIGNNLAGQHQWVCTGILPQTFQGSQPTGGSGGYLYLWESSTDSLSWTTTGITQPQLNPTAVGWYRRIVQSGACAPDTSPPVQYIIQPPISQNSIGNAQTICAGAVPALLSGSSPSSAFGQYGFQWESSLTQNNWQPISGGSLLGLSLPALSQATYYRRVVTSSVCVDTSPSLLILTLSPISGNQIGIDQTICTGGTPSAIMGTVPQGGSGLYDYTWESSVDSLNWNPISGETLQTLQPGPIFTSTYFRRRVHSMPCDDIPSNAVFVFTDPLIGNNQIAQAQTICTGTSFQQLTGAVPSGGNGQYQYSWQTSLNLNTWQPVSGITDANLNGFALVQSIYFRRWVGSGTCPQDTSNFLYVHVQTPPGGNTLPHQVSVCNAPGNILLTGSTPNAGNGLFQYLWEQSPDSINWTSLPGATQMHYNGTMPWSATYLRRIVTSGVCPPDTAMGMVVLSDSLVGNNFIGTNQIICSGTQALLLSGTIATGSLSPPAYVWQESTDSLIWTAATGVSTLQFYQPPNLSSTRYYRRIAARGACDADTTPPVIIRVEAIIGNNTLLPQQTLCIGSMPLPLTGSLPTGGNGTYAYQWESSNNLLTWQTISGSSGQHYSPGGLPFTTYFRRSIRSGVCPPNTSAPLPIYIELPATPNIITASHTVCSGQNAQWLTGSMPSGGSGIYQYQWQTSADLISWQDIPFAQQANLNPGMPAQPLYYRRLLSSGVCTGHTSNAVKITVLPTPDIQVLGLNLCPGLGGFLQAYSSFPGGTWAWSTGGNAAQEWVQPSVTSTYSVAYTVGGCTSTLLQTTAQVYPPAVGNILPGNSVALCAGGTLTLTAEGGVHYQWTGQFSAQAEYQVQTPGTYSVVVTDSNGCKDTAYAVVNGLSALQIQVSIQPPRCHNTQDGVLTAQASGSLPPYAYSWNTTPTISTYQLTGLNQGSYLVSVTDAAGCTQDRQVVITPPLPLSLNTGSSPVPCDALGISGSAWVNVSGGTGPYYYQWGTTPSQTTPTAAGLSSGIYPVTVTDNRGCIASTVVSLSPAPAPVVSVSSDTFVCAGSGGIAIQAGASGGVPPYIYYWYQSAWIVSGSISDINSPSPTVNPDTSGWYKVVVTGDNGCVSIADSVFVEVVPLPIADAGPDVFFCQGAPGAFLSGSIVNPTGSYQVQWTPSTGLFCDTCLSTYALPTTPTLYTLKVTDVVTGCSSDSTTLNTLSTALVNIRPRPVVYAGPDTAICLGDIAQLGGSATGAGPNYSWHWSPALGLNDSTLQMPSASPPNSTYYSLTVVSNGCESVADSILLSIIPVPVVSAGTVRNICRGDSVQLPATVQQGGIFTYTWSPGTGLSDSTILNPMASPQNTTVYHIQARHQGCNGLSDSVMVIVHDVPIAEAGIDYLICAHADSITLNGTFTGGSAPVRHHWSPAYGLDRTDVLNPRSRPDSSVMYYLHVSSGVAPTECSTYDSMLVTVIPGVHAEILPPDTFVICRGDTLKMQANGGVGGASYQWWPAAGLSNTQSAVTYASPEQNTRYYVAVSEAGCHDTAYWDIFVHPTPDAAFSISQAQGCAPLEIYTQNLSSNGYSYEWKVSGTTFHSNEPEPVIRFDQPGVYSIHLVVRGIGQCMDSMTHPLPIRVGEHAEIIAASEPQAPVELSLPMSPIRLIDFTQDVEQRTWHWSDGNAEGIDTVYKKWHSPGTYFVTLFVRTFYGCEATKELGPFVIRNPILFIPNVFSPNNDGVHDRFVIEYDGDELFHLQVMDRWGTLLFESHNPENTWDGRSPQGAILTETVYFYHLQIGEKAYAGSVTLVR